VLILTIICKININSVKAKKTIYPSISTSSGTKYFQVQFIEIFYHLKVGMLQAAVFPENVDLVET